MSEHILSLVIAVTVVAGSLWIRSAVLDGHWGARENVPVASAALQQDQAVEAITAGAQRAAHRRELRSFIKEPRRLLGASQDDVLALLREPEWVREEVSAPLRLWQYRTSACVLDVYLSDQKVAHYEMRARKSQPLVTKVKDRCLSVLAQQGKPLQLVDLSTAFGER